MKKILWLILVSSGLAACANSVDMTYYSEPAGATITEQGMGTLGVAPVTVRYSPTPDEVKEGRMNTGRVTATWTSGAKVSVPSITADITSDKKASYAFIRPVGASGIEADRTYAVTVQHATIVEPDQDLFDTLNRNISCGWYNLIDAVYAGCDP